MRVAGAPADAPGRQAEPAASATPLARLTATLSVLALFLLCRPYFGIRHDARIYVGRAEADLGLAGMAQSLMFAHDGQSQYSIFGALLRPAVQHLGSASAAMLFTAAGLAIWLCAAFLLLSRICRGLPLWGGLVALATLPATYGTAFAYGEPFVTPRPIAEALVCLSLACALDRRWIVSGALLALAAALHPIMTVPGVTVCGLMLVLHDRRWLILVAVGVMAALGAAFAGLPLVERLVTPIDPTWLRILEQRSSYLFPALWSERSWSLLIRQSLTLVIAASLLHGQKRQLVVAALLAGLLGVLVCVAAPTLLVIQVQPWRAQWIVALLSTALLPFTLARLWSEGSGGRTAAAFLAVAWGASPPQSDAAVAGLALLVHLLPQARNLPALVWRTAWTAAALLLARDVALSTMAAIANVQAVGFDNVITRMLFSKSLAIITGGLAVVAVLRSSTANRIAGRPWAAALSALPLVAGLLLWNAQDDWTRARDGSLGTASLRAQLPPGPVLWLSGDGRSGPWTGRPEWWSVNEGASAVFDRALAIEWARRFEIVARAGLTSRRIEMLQGTKRPSPKLTKASLAMVCGASEGPRAIVAPLEQTASDLQSEAGGRWLAPAGQNGRRTATFLIFRCV